MPHVEASFEYCGLALLPHMNNFDLPPGTESTNEPLLNPFFFFKKYAVVCCICCVIVAVVAVVFFMMSR